MLRMPAEWEPHERTLIGWPCKLSSWGQTLDTGRREFAAVANAIAEFEPVTMVCATSPDAQEARVRLSQKVDIVTLPMDGSWLRDNGPVFVTGQGKRQACHFRFNAWAQRHALRDRDIALGGSIARLLGDEVIPIDVVTEGGALHVNGAGTLVTTEGCVMHPLRNWQLSKQEVDERLCAALGCERVIWLPQGLEEDLDRTYGTDGHIDLFFDFLSTDSCFLLKVPDDDPNAEHLATSKALLESAGIHVIDFPYMTSFMADDRSVIAPYLNFYVCNGAVIVPVAEADPDMDTAAVSMIAEHWPGREVVPVKMRAGPMQGGAIHCLTQQVPAIPSS